ncbi:MAG TPA: chemotaxis protein CheW [Blastocatellia bacterium]|nr:chemotaxis protein CheW [Blastocatellia bacterium]
MIDEIPNHARAFQGAVSETQSPRPAASLETIIAQVDLSLANTRRVTSQPSAAVHAFTPTRTSQSKYIVFSLADARYAVPIGQVIEVGELERITPVPNVPDWVLGVTNLRGDIISVVDCGAFLHLHEKITLEMSSMCVVRNRNHDLTTTLLVDRIEGMMDLTEDLIVLPETCLGDHLIPYLQGVYDDAGQLLNVLNLEGMLSSMELSQ